MLQKFRSLLKNEKGLTLIELLAVVVILGIIAAIAVPSIGKIIENAREDAIIADGQQLMGAARLALLDDIQPTTAGELSYSELNNYLDKFDDSKYSSAIVTINGDSVTGAVLTPKNGETINLDKDGKETTSTEDDDTEG
ncbi:type II secretion system protein [Bacillus haimaensis]|uniref:type IV pilin protein n=1 Tax=Bacillus haimaensis TaxID=3160967 RepID=UPI003AA83C08